MNIAECMFCGDEIDGDEGQFCYSCETTAEDIGVDINELAW